MGWIPTPLQERQKGLYGTFTYHGIAHVEASPTRFLTPENLRIRAGLEGAGFLVFDPFLQNDFVDMETLAYAAMPTEQGDIPVKMTVFHRNIRDKLL